MAPLLLLCGLGEAGLAECLTREKENSIVQQCQPGGRVGRWEEGGRKVGGR